MLRCSPPFAGDNHGRYPAHFQNPIPLQAQYATADKSVDVVKRGGPDHDKGQDRRRSDESQPRRSWGFPGPPEQGNYKEDADQGDAHNEPELHGATLFVPTLIESNHATQLRQCGLKIQLLVDGEAEEKDRNDLPQHAFA